MRFECTDQKVSMHSQLLSVQLVARVEYAAIVGLFLHEPVPSIAEQMPTSIKLTGLSMLHQDDGFTVLSDRSYIDCVPGC